MVVSVVLDFNLQSLHQLTNHNNLITDSIYQLRHLKFKHQASLVELRLCLQLKHFDLALNLVHFGVKIIDHAQTPCKLVHCKFKLVNPTLVLPADVLYQLK